MGLIVRETPSRAPLLAPYEILRELGARAHPTYAAWHRRPGGEGQLVALEHFVGAGKTGDEGAAAFLREARAIAQATQPNLPHVREVSVHGADVVVASEFIDGVKLSDVWCTPARPDVPQMPLEIAVRVLIDVLAGVGALHGLCDPKRPAKKLAHGEVSPATIVVGIDGVARVLHAVARRAPGGRPEDESNPYLAPEAGAEGTCDGRADTYGVGVMLWEALSGRSLFPDGRARGPVPPLPPAEAPEKPAWAKRLVEAAAKAIVTAPGERWPTAAAMRSEIRKVAGLEVASVSTTAAWIRRVAGDGVRERRQKLESAATSPSSPAPNPTSSGTMATPLRPARPSFPSDPAPAVPVPPAPRLPGSSGRIGPDTESAIQVVLDRASPPSSGAFQVDPPAGTTAPPPGSQPPAVTTAPPPGSERPAMRTPPPRAESMSLGSLRAAPGESNRAGAPLGPSSLVLPISVALPAHEPLDVQTRETARPPPLPPVTGERQVFVHGSGPRTSMVAPSTIPRREQWFEPIPNRKPRPNPLVLIAVGCLVVIALGLAVWRLLGHASTLGLRGTSQWHAPRSHV